MGVGECRVRLRFGQLKGDQRVALASSLVTMMLVLALITVGEAIFWFVELFVCAATQKSVTATEQTRATATILKCVDRSTLKNE
jgi:hypothetical protein